MLEIELLDDGVCLRCLSPIATSKHNCNNCSDNPWYCDRLYAKFKYATPLSKILHALKYRRQTAHAWSLGFLLYQSLPQNMQYDVIVPIPLHKVRQKQRGFNQSELLLGYLKAQKPDILIDPTLVMRTLDTTAQTLAAKGTRKDNLENAFSLKPKANLLGSKILLIDDVVTTGATINAVAKLLKAHGAETVDACCLLRTIHTLCL